MQMGQNSLCTSETPFPIVRDYLIRESGISAESGRNCAVQEKVGKEDENYSESTYAGSGNQLTIVKLDALEIVTRLQKMIEAGVCDKGAIVQFQYCQMFRCARRESQLSDAFVGDQFTVRQTLREESHRFREVSFLASRDISCV